MNNQTAFTEVEILSRYAAGERSFADAGLSSVVLNFDGADLQDVDFSDSFLVASFRGANLRGARFCRSNVKTCDFSGADLTNADFSNSAIDAAVFLGATLTGARFTDAHLQGYSMKMGELPTWVDPFTI